MATTWDGAPTDSSLRTEGALPQPLNHGSARLSAGGGQGKERVMLCSPVGNLWGPVSDEDTRFILQEEERCLGRNWYISTEDLGKGALKRIMGHRSTYQHNGVTYKCFELGPAVIAHLAQNPQLTISSRTSRAPTTHNYIGRNEGWTTKENLQMLTFPLHWAYSP